MTLRELQLFSVEIMKDVHDFCVKNNIMYSLLDGSLIGAIRHKGFIPWDDDIDIIMKRPDYELFCRTYKSDHFLLKCRENDPNCLVAYARVYDNKRTMAKSLSPWCRDEAGVGIDIMPADSVMEDVEEFSSYYDIIRKYWSYSNSSRSAIGPFVKQKSLSYNFKLFVKKIIFIDGWLTGLFVKKVIKMAQKTEWGTTPYWSQLTSMGDHIKGHHRIEVFTSTILKPFEDTHFMVMNGYDEYLTDKYHNYMELPPVEKRQAHYCRRTNFYWK